MSMKEEYLQKGYVFHGYFPPELTSEEEYPDYIKIPTQIKADKINSIRNESTFTFAFMADTHFTPTHNHHIRLMRALSAYRDVADRVGVDRLIVAGDLGANGTREFALNSLKEFGKHLEGINFYPAVGNHDDNTIWQACIESPKSEHHLTNDEIYDTLFSHLPALNVRTGKEGRKTYYYFDDAICKVRYIVLDITDIPYVMEDGNLKYKSQHIYAYSQNQLDWLTKDALSFAEDGWSIVFITHNAATGNAAEDSYLGVLNDILGAYKNANSIKADFYDDEFRVSVDCDFSHLKRADIVGVFYGHYHSDIITKDKNGIVYIATSNATMYNHGDHIRKDGTFGEILFDVVTVDKSNRKIYLTRIGYGEDREVSY